jgi:hypothetical protein
MKSAMPKTISGLTKSILDCHTRSRCGSSLTHLERQQIATLSALGWSLRRIGRVVGCCHKTVAKWLARQAIIQGEPVSTSSGLDRVRPKSDANQIGSASNKRCGSSATVASSTTSHQFLTMASPLLTAPDSCELIHSNCKDAQLFGRFGKSHAIKAAEASPFAEVVGGAQAMQPGAHDVRPLVRLYPDEIAKLLLVYLQEIGLTGPVTSEELRGAWADLMIERGYADESWIRIAKQFRILIDDRKHRHCYRDRVRVVCFHVPRVGDNVRVFPALAAEPDAP